MTSHSQTVDIDLDEQFQHLNHAPIVEAVIEIRARAQLPWEEQRITEQFKSRLLPDYPQVFSQNQVQQEITLDSEEPRSVVRDLGWQGLRFQSGDNKRIARFTRDLFSFSRLHPYENWDRLFNEAIRLWQVHLDITKPLELQRVGLRFLNRILVPPGADCQNYIALKHQPINRFELPISGFFYLDTRSVPAHPLRVNIVRTIQPPATPEIPSTIILDIDAFTTTAFRVDADELAQRLRQLRWLKNKIFFGTITETALDEFK